MKDTVPRPRRLLIPLMVLALLPSPARAQAPSWQPWGPEFRANTYTTLAQFMPSAAWDVSGNFVVVWTSQGQDGSSGGAYGQLFAPSVPVQLMTIGVE